MKQEYVLVLIAGLLIAAYVLEAVVDPLTLDLATPYHYIQPETLRTYPFTTTVIVVRAIALFLAPVWVLSFVERKYGLKISISLVLGALTQLYVLQELATGQQLLPLEWSLSISLAGLAMLLMMIAYFVRGMLSSAHEKLTHEDKKNDDQSTDDNESQEEE